jgi:hypothetical protein
VQSEVEGKRTRIQWVRNLNHHINPASFCFAFEIFLLNKFSFLLFITKEQIAGKGYDVFLKIEKTCENPFYITVLLKVWSLRLASHRRGKGNFSGREKSRCTGEPWVEAGALEELEKGQSG